MFMWSIGFFSDAFLVSTYEGITIVLEEQASAHHTLKIFPFEAATTVSYLLLPSALSLCQAAVNEGGYIIKCEYYLCCCCAVELIRIF